MPAEPDVSGVDTDRTEGFGMSTYSLEEITMSWLDQQDPVLVQRRIEELRETPPRAADYTRDERFALWLHMIDMRCLSHYGLSIFDLADQAWHDWYGDGMSPREALGLALADDEIGRMLLEEFGHV